MALRALHTASDATEHGVARIYRLASELAGPVAVWQKQSQDVTRLPRGYRFARASYGHDRVSSPHQHHPPQPPVSVAWLPEQEKEQGQQLQQS